MLKPTNLPTKESQVSLEACVQRRVFDFLFSITACQQFPLLMSKAHTELTVDAGDPLSINLVPTAPSKHYLPQPWTRRNTSARTYRIFLST